MTLPPAQPSRRVFLRASLAGLGSLSLPGLLRMRAESAGRRPASGPR